MENEITFEEAPVEEPIEETETKKLSARLAALESKISSILQALELLKKAKEDTKVEMKSEEMNKEISEMKKKIEELANTPARMTQVISSSDNRFEELAKKWNTLSAGEMIAYCEHRGISWGNKGE